MSKIKVVDLEGKIVQEHEINDNLIVKKPHNQAMFDQVLAENAGSRQGTHATLTKGEVRGGGKKPVAQKHSGRARQGSIRNPHYVGGGIAFGPKPNRNYKLSINSSAAKLAINSAFAIHLKRNSIFGLKDGDLLKTPSTKKVLLMLKNINLLTQKVLIILDDQIDNSLKLSAQNISKVCAKKWNQVSTKDLLHADVVIAQLAAIDKAIKIWGNKE